MGVLHPLGLSARGESGDGAGFGELGNHHIIASSSILVVIVTGRTLVVLDPTPSTSMERVR